MFNDYYKKKRVFITGHTGFKGSWLSQWLINLGAELAGYSLNIPTNPSNFEVLELEKSMKHFSGDVRNLDDLRKAMNDFKPEVVFHLAAQSLVRFSYDDPKTTFDTNLGGTVNLLEVIRNTPFVDTAVLITSDKCYENVEWEWGYRENDRLGGKDPYSASKACAEIAISAYQRSFFGHSDRVRIASTRAGNVIGGGDWAEDRIVPDCIRAWAEGKKPVIRSPRSTRPWQHVLEPLSGYLTLGALMGSGKPGLSMEAFNFGPSAEVNQPVSVLIKQMMETWNNSDWKDVSGADDGKKEAQLLKLSCDKALQRLSWRPTMSFKESVNMTAEWYKAYYSKSCDMKELTRNQISSYKMLAKERQQVWAVSKG